MRTRVAIERTKDRASWAIWGAMIGVLLGGAAGAYTCPRHKSTLPQPEVRYVLVHDIAARRGRPTCPKVNSGTVLSHAIETGKTGGPYMIQCVYAPDASLSLPAM